MRLRVSPSLLSADFSRLGREIELVQAAGADMIHLDVMDGHFVPNLTFGNLVIKSVSSVARVPLDAHLMVTDPDLYLDQLCAAGVSMVAVHVEACLHLHRTITTIKKLGMKAGIALNPATALCHVEAALGWVDFLTVMAVNPGFGGQQFIPESIERISRLREMIGPRDVEISVDGGVDDSNAPALVAAGASILVAGSFIFGNPDKAAAIQCLRQANLEGVSE